MSRLLNLPVELRLHIYTFVLVEKRPVSLMDCMTIGAALKPVSRLQQFDVEVQDDMPSLFWSSNTVLLRMTRHTFRGHAKAVKRLRLVLRHWLDFVARDVAQHIRKLQICTTTMCGAHRDCINSIIVDFRRDPKDAGTVEAERECHHKHYLVSRLGEKMASCPRIKGRPQASREMVSDLFEICVATMEL